VTSRTKDLLHTALFVRVGGSGQKTFLQLYSLFILALRYVEWLCKNYLSLKKNKCILCGLCKESVACKITKDGV